ncbi:POT family-domain-containing protein [Mycena leptocephala]|nr:POT family-domain-containing protein [Mycena leptocephala]
MRKGTLPTGEVAIVSPFITVQSIFLCALLYGDHPGVLRRLDGAPFLARDNGFWVAYLVPTCIIAVVPIVLVACRKYCVITPPRGSILLETFRVVGVCLRARAAWSWINPAKLWEDLTLVGSPSLAPEIPPSITWDDEFVDEVHRTLEACKVFLFFPIFWLCWLQINGNLGTVAAGMTLHGTPNDLIKNLDAISIVILIPVFECTIYPSLRKMGVNFSPIKRITAGFFVAGLGELFYALTMVYSSVLEKFLYDRSPCPNHQPAACRSADSEPAAGPLNVWIISGPYILVSISLIFTAITGNEYAYTKAPKHMKSVVSAFASLQTAIASALNFALTPVSVEQRFQWLFTSVAIAVVVFGGYSI